MIVTVVVVVLLGLYILSTMCRHGHKGLEGLQDRIYTHRGLHGVGVPENSLAAFQRAKEAGYGIELDVHLLADGELAVIHDSDLRRITGSEGCIEDLTSDQLEKFTLCGTTETIPLFSQVLSLCEGEVPLIIELKSHEKNYTQLCEKVCSLMEHYQGSYCLESFDPHCVYWLRKNRPDIVRGQLVINYLSSKTSKLPWLIKFFLVHQMLNFITFPDFVAYRFCDRKTISNTIVRKLWGAPGVAWTVKTREEFDTALSEKWIPIFEGFIP